MKSKNDLQGSQTDQQPSSVPNAQPVWENAAQPVLNTKSPEPCTLFCRFASLGKQTLSMGWRYALTILVVYILWKLAALGLATGSAAGVLPQPEKAFTAFMQALGEKEFWMHCGASAWRSCAGMALAWLIGFPLGIAMGSGIKIDAFFTPFLALTYPIPKIVLLPILLVLLGLGDGAKIAMISITLGYQVLVTTRDGVRNIHPCYVDSLRSLGASPVQIYREVLLPAALPHGFTALRLNSGVSVAILFFVESFATQWGLGYLIMDAWGRLDYDGMFTGVLGMSLLGVLLYECANMLERKVCAWQFLRRRS